MGKEPNGAMGTTSMYGDMCKEALDTFDRLHPSLKTIDEKEKKAKASAVEVKPSKKPEILNVTSPSDKGSVKTFDKELANELIDILRENKLSIIELNDERIVFEYKGKKMLFLPI